MNSIIDVLRSLQTTPAQISAAYFLDIPRNSLVPALLSRRCTEAEKSEGFKLRHYRQDKSLRAKRIFSQL